MTIEEFNDIYIKSITNYKPLRKGQNLFNKFAEILQTEEWFKNLIGTNKDPFYTDENILRFLDEIIKHINNGKEL